MWNTPQGIRILIGAEAALVQDAISIMADIIHDGADDSIPPAPMTGVVLFDQLSWTQRLAELDRVATALLKPFGPAFQPSAVHEAAVGAIFSMVAAMVEQECLDGDDDHWRKQVLAACHECLAHDPDAIKDLPTSPKLNDRDQWTWVIDCLADQILWDRDYELAGHFLDAPPEKAAQVRRIMGIDDAYFVDAAADVTEQSAETVYQHLRQLAADGRSDDSVSFSSN